MEFSRTNIAFTLLVLTYICLWASAVNDFFFWDTIQLGSKQAHFFYEASEFSLLLPNEIDSGHFPLFGLYLSVWWDIFGKTLFFSHLAMLPWVLWIVYVIYRLTTIYCAENYRYLMVIIVCLEPTLLAQITLISPDVILVASFLSVWLYYQKNNALNLAVFVLVLSLISLRGFMVAGALFSSACLIWWQDKKNKKSLLRIPAFLPGMIAVLLFLGYHYQKSAWIGFHADSPWSPSFTKVSFSGILYNSGLFIWRIFDFGRVGIFILLIYLLKKEKRTFGLTTNFMFVSGILTTLVLAGVTIGFQSLTAHRYYMPIYLIFLITSLHLLYKSDLTSAIKKRISLGLAICLISGHFWVYADGVSKGWDSSLSFRPVFSLYNDVENYLKIKGIEKKEVTSFFPFLSKEKYWKLNDSSDCFANAEEQKTKYLLLSNIHNDAPDSLFNIYSKENALYYVKSGSVWMGLFQTTKK
jgi:hypothetical protein